MELPAFRGAFLVCLACLAIIFSVSDSLPINCDRSRGQRIFCEIPQNVFRIRIIAIGAKGGPVASCNGGPCQELGGTALQGGLPGRVDVEIDVFEGDVFDIYLGQQGGQDTTVSGAGGAALDTYFNLSYAGGSGSCIECADNVGGAVGCGGK